MPGYLFVHGRPYGLQELRLEGIQVFAGDDVIYPMPFRPPEEEGKYRPTEDEEFNELLREVHEEIQSMKEERMAPKEIATTVVTWLRRKDPTLEIDINRFDFNVGVATPEMSKEGWAVVVHTGVFPWEQTEEPPEEVEPWDPEEYARSFFEMIQDDLQKGRAVLLGYGYQIWRPPQSVPELFATLARDANPELSLEEREERLFHSVILSRTSAREFLENVPYDFILQELENITEGGKHDSC